jgi:hypothetical protein
MKIPPTCITGLRYKNIYLIKTQLIVLIKLFIVNHLGQIIRKLILPIISTKNRNYEL